MKPKTNRNKILKRRLKLRMIIERKFKKDMSKRLKVMAKTFTRQIAKQGASNIQLLAEFAVKAEMPKTIKLIQRYHKKTMYALGRDVISELQKNHNVFIKKSALQNFESYILEWIDSLPYAERIINIGFTTKREYIEEANKIIAARVNEGMGLNAREIAKELNVKLFKNANGMRSTRIARTETTIASSRGLLGSVEAMKVEGLFKVWLAVGDDRTRESHRFLDGKEAPFNGFFRINGGQYDGPGDPNLPPSEVINCRCTLDFRK